MMVTQDGKTAAENPSDRENATTTEREFDRWRVRQWSDLRMQDPQRGQVAEVVKRMLDSQDQRMEIYAAMFRGALANRCAQYEPIVKVVRVKKRPQLMIELTVPAASEAEATRKARYWINRAFSQRSSATLPLGKHQVAGVR